MIQTLGAGPCEPAQANWCRLHMAVIWQRRWFGPHRPCAKEALEPGPMVPAPTISRCLAAWGSP
jgi:hypothetical protein